MQNLVSYTDLNGHTVENILASSPAEHKRLVIRTTVFKTNVLCEYVIYHNNIVSSVCPQLWSAVKEYNQIK